MPDEDEEDGLLGQLSKPKDEKEGWERIPCVVDSGADDHALPEDVASWLPIEPSRASREGRCFRGASDEKIPAKGRRILRGKTAEGHIKRISGKVCPVRRVLLSAARIAAAGNKVVIGDKRAFILHIKSKQVTNLRKQGRAWILDVWIKRLEPDAPVFPRRGE